MHYGRPTVSYFLKADNVTVTRGNDSDQVTLLQVRKCYLFSLHCILFITGNSFESQGNNNIRNTSEVVLRPQYSQY